MEASQKKPAAELKKEILQYMEILKQDPRSKIFAPLAGALLSFGKTREAERICLLGLEAHPDFSDGHYTYANIMLKLEKNQQALEHSLKAIDLNHTHLDAYLLAAEIFLAQDQIEQASKICMQALDVDPEHAGLADLLRRLHLQSSPPDRSASAPDSFRLSKGTLPGRNFPQGVGLSRRVRASKEILQQAGQEAEDLLQEQKQPFSALSSGSQPGDENETKKNQTYPSDTLANTIEHIQAIIDRYRTTRAPASTSSLSPFRLFHLRKLWLLFWILVGLSGMTALALFLVRHVDLFV